MNAPSTVEPATHSLGSALKTTVRKITSNGEAAISALRAMQRRRSEIEAKFASVIAECKAIVAEATEAERDFSQNASRAGVRKLCELRPKANAADEIFQEWHRRTGPLADSEFFTECRKDLRPTLLKAAKHRLKEAEKRFSDEHAHARSTLAAENFDTEEIAAAPKVRAAQRLVERFERLISNINSSKDEVLWTHATSLLDE